MRDLFGEQLNELNRELTIMGSSCEEIIALASQALTDWDEELVQKERTRIRFNSRDKLVKKLWDVYGNRYSRDIFVKSNQLLDKELKEQPIKEKEHSLKRELSKSKVMLQLKKRKTKELEL